jgi:hypothetical protein
MFFYIYFFNWVCWEVKQDILKPDLCLCVLSSLILAVSMHFWLWMLDVCRSYRSEQIIIVYLVGLVSLIMFFNTVRFIACSVLLSNVLRSMQFGAVAYYNFRPLMGSSCTTLVILVKPMPLTRTETSVANLHPDVRSRTVTELSIICTSAWNPFAARGQAKLDHRSSSTCCRGHRNPFLMSTAT